MFATSFQARNSRRGMRLTVSSSIVGAAAAVIEFGVIVLTSAITGAAWHLFSYDQPGDVQAYVNVGALTGVLYTLPFLFRSE